MKSLEENLVTTFFENLRKFIPCKDFTLHWDKNIDRLIINIVSPNNLLYINIEMSSIYNGYHTELTLDIKRNYDCTESTKEFWYEDSIVNYLEKEYKRMGSIEKDQIDNYYSKHYFY